MLAARGTRETGQGIQPIDAPDLVARIRQVAGRVQRRALLFAVVCAALVFFCPA